MFHLPVGDTHIEGGEWIQGSAILTSVRMLKDHNDLRSWRMHPDDMELLLSLFADAIA